MSKILCVFIVPSSNPLSKQMMRRKPHALASTPATPKKNVSCFFDLAGVNFFLKMERTFFFGVLPSKYSGSAWGFNTDSAKRKSIFLGERIFRFASADFPLAKCATERFDRESLISYTYNISYMRNSANR